MKQSRITYVIAGQNVPDKGRLFSHLVVLNPKVIIILDEPGLAREIADRFPDCTVIFRWNGDGGDGDIYQRMMPKPWLAMMMSKLQGDRRIMLYTNNESGLPRRLIAWLTELIPLANEIGVSLCCLNLATGNPQPEQWEIAKPLLELLATNRQHVLGLHEYAGGVVTSGLYGGYPDNAGVEPGTTGGKNLVPRDSWPDDVSKVTRYHMGRFKFLLDYLDREHIKYPRIVLTEHGFDDTSDIKAWEETLKKTPPFQNIRGWKSLINQWTAWWPQWSAERAYFEQIKWANETIYKGSPVEAQAIFCWGNSGGWEQFDVAGATDFQDMLAAYANEPDTVPEPIPTPHPIPPFPGDSRYQRAIFKTTGANTILREYPSVSARDLARIVADEVRYIPAAKLTDDEKHHDQLESGEFAFWLPTVLHNLIGYVRDDVVEIVPIVPPTEPPPLDLAVMFRQHREVYSLFIEETKRELQPLLDEKHALDNKVNHLQKRIEAFQMLLGDYDIIEEYINRKAAA